MLERKSQPICDSILPWVAEGVRLGSNPTQLASSTWQDMVSSTMSECLNKARDSVVATAPNRSWSLRAIHLGFGNCHMVFLVTTITYCSQKSTPPFPPFA